MGKLPLILTTAALLAFGMSSSAFASGGPFCFQGKLVELMDSNLERVAWNQVRSVTDRALREISQQTDLSVKLKLIQKIGQISPIDTAIGKGVAAHDGLLLRIDEATLYPFRQLQALALQSTDPAIQNAAIDAMHAYFGHALQGRPHLEKATHKVIHMLHAKIESRELSDKIWEKMGNPSTQNEGRRLGVGIHPTDPDTLADQFISAQRKTIPHFGAAEDLAVYAKSRGFRSPLRYHDVLADATKQTSRKLLGDDVLLEYQFRRIPQADGTVVHLEKPRTAQIQGVVVDQDEKTLLLLDPAGSLHRLDWDGNSTRVERYFVRHRAYANAGESAATLRSTLLKLDAELFRVPPPTLREKEKILKKLTEIRLSKKLQQQMEDYAENFTLVKSIHTQIMDLIAITPDPAFQKKAIQSWYELAAVHPGEMPKEFFFVHTDELLGNRLLTAEAEQELLRYVALPKNASLLKRTRMGRYLREPDIETFQKNNRERILKEQRVEDRLKTAAQDFSVDLKGKTLEGYAADNGYAPLPANYLHTYRYRTAKKRPLLPDEVSADGAEYGTQVLVELIPANRPPVLLEFPLYAEKQLTTISGKSAGGGAEGGAEFYLNDALQAARVYVKKIKRSDAPYSKKYEDRIMNLLMGTPLY